MYEPTTFVEPLGYQPVEFLDIPRMSESRRASVAPTGPIGLEHETRDAYAKR